MSARNPTNRGCAGFSSTGLAIVATTKNSEPQVTVSKRRQENHKNLWVYEFQKAGVVRVTVCGCGKGVFTIEKPDGGGVFYDASKGSDVGYFWPKKAAMLKAYQIAEASL